MRIVLVFVFSLIFAACTAVDAPPVPSATPSPTVQPTLTGTSLPTPTVESVSTQTVPEVTQQPTETAAPQIDFSAVWLFEATPLMDPQYFQVGLAGWPADAPMEIVMQVGGEVYQCDLLFPAEYPDRLYCWGPAPPRGAQAVVEVFMPGDVAPLHTIMFTVP